MALKLMYITNSPQVASIAQDCGVDRIFVDMEYIGKEERQGGLDTVKSHHTIEDVINIRKVLNKTKLLVRVNPIHEAGENWCSSEEEINAVVEAGADIIMLPMAKTADEIKKFVEYVGGRTKTMLLLETAEAKESIRAMLDVGGIDMVHIGLNDLHLSYGMKFMFQLLTDGTVEELCKIIDSYGIPYGFGGIARIGFGMLPAERVIAEHYRLGSSMAILSRSFCDIYKTSDMAEVKRLFEQELQKIREYETELTKKDDTFFKDNQEETNRLVDIIVEKIQK
jgi:hypothetical protein